MTTKTTNSIKTLAFRLLVAGLLLLSAAPAALAVTFFTSSSSLTASDPTQSGRLSATNIPSTWASSKAFPGVINAGTTYHYRTYTVTNAALAANRYVQVSFDDPGAKLFASAYAGSFDPLNQSTGYLGDLGRIGNSTDGNPLWGQIMVPAGQDLVVVVVDTLTSDGGLGDPFALRVEGFADTLYTENLPPTFTNSALSVATGSTLTDLAALTGASPSGGVFSGTGVSVNGGGKYVFDPAGLALGTQVTVTYTVTLPGGPNSSTFTITVTEAPSLVVTTTNDVVDNLDGLTSLREAITYANSGNAGANLITFDAAVTGIITLTSGELTISASMTVRGPGANMLAISGGSASRIFNIAAGSATVTLSGLTIRDGKTSSGGGAGIYVANGTLAVTSCTITSNDASGSGQTGGGIYNVGGTLTVRNSTIANNKADQSGGGIQVGYGFASLGTSVTLQNSTVTGNSTVALGGSGGAVCTTYGSLVASNCTIYANAAYFGGNLGDEGGSITLNNTIVAGGIILVQGGSAPDLSSNANSGGHNLIGDGTGSGGLTNGVNGDQVGTAATPIDPLLGALANNGGPMQTMKLLAGSPALNAGSNALIPPDALDLDSDSDTTEAAPFDQRGTGFPRLRGSVVDIGAFEGNTPPTITLPAVVPIVVEATKPQGADVTFTITASDAEDGDLTASLMVDHPSGSTFALGDTTVNVSVTDSDGATTTDSFVVTVQDTTPPVITPHANIEVAATQITGAVVTYTATVTDAVGAAVYFDPESGSTFPLGVTTVTITAEDAALHVVTSTFTVTVRLDNPVNTPAYVAGGAVIGATGAPGAPPTDAKWATFGSPAIDENGHLTFVSTWTSQTSGKGTGLFTDTACVAIVGGPVPNVTGATFKSFADPVIHDRRVASIVNLNGVSKTTASGILTVTVSPLVAPPEGPESVIAVPTSDAALVVRAGDVATPDGAKFKTFKSVDVRGTSTGFAASLTAGTGSPKTTAATDGGVWITSPTLAPKLMLREGQTIGDRKIASLTTFDSSAGSRGQGRGWFERIGGLLSTPARVVFTDRKQAIVSSSLVGTNVSTDTLIATDDIFAGGFLVTNGFGLPTVNSFGQVATIASTASDTGPRQGIEVQLDGANYERIAVRLGATPLAGATFSTLQDPVLSEDGAVAFPAKIKGSGIKGVAANTLWWQPAGSNLTLLARGGAPTVGATPNDLPKGAQWSAFSSLAIAADRGPIFVGTLVAGKGNVTKASANGVWAMDDQGKLRTLFRTNDPIVLDPTHTKTLKSFNILTPTVGNTGITRSHNGTHQLTWLATFTDKSQAIIVTTIP